MSYSASTIQRSATILANTGADLPTLVALIASAQNRTTTPVAPVKPAKVEPVKATRTRSVKREPIAPEAGIYADPSIAQAIGRTPQGDASDNNQRNWRNAKPTAAQIKRNRSYMARINRAESLLDYRLSTFQSLNGGKACRFKAGEYSDLYQNVLKPMALSLEAECEALFA